jgi:hypothetical protein
MSMTRDPHTKLSRTLSFGDPERVALHVSLQTTGPTPPHPTHAPYLTRAP